MRVAVTGATGNVGTALLVALAAEPAVDEVIGIARRRPDGAMAKTRWVEADVGRDDLRTALDGADVVVHLAWLLQPSRDPVAQWRTNVVGTRRVLEAAGSAAAVVVASSVGAYSPGPKEPVTEDYPTDGIATSTYSWQKAYVERLVDEFEHERPDVRVVRLRPGLIFQRAASTAIRRLFLGPFLPGPLLDLDRLPVLPDVPGLRVQAVHSDDVAEAYRRAVVGDVRGAFNIAADPVLDARVVAEAVGARLVPFPRAALRAAVAAAWRARLIPVDPGWIDLGLRSPLLDSGRARTELGWTPERSALDALRDLAEGIRTGAGGSTPPLDPATSGPARVHELSTGIGARDD